MAYSELIKNFERVRDYMRQFYVYGFKSRDEYDAKSARSYDNERRRIESWLGDYMSFRQDAAGKNVFISVDSRTIPRNPLYNAFKAKSFTNGDITFHFYIMDLLTDGAELPIGEIVDAITDKYLSSFDTELAVDESTVRKKLKEYESLGLLASRKRGRQLVYCRTDSKSIDLTLWRDAIAFFSEDDPLGVVGSFLLDKLPETPEYFGFKHHYILHALDSEVLCDILLAIGEGRSLDLTIRSPRNKGVETCHTVFPVKIYISTQSGRQYLLGYHYTLHKPMFFRIDSIRNATAGVIEKNPDKYSGWYGKFRENLWGVSIGIEHNIDHIEMTVHIADNEGYILERLEREKRCGKITIIDAHTCVFSADVYDATEMLPWIRTFIGRIEKLECSDPDVTETFYADLKAMTAMYGGDADAV
ncbi:MAG: WYL domain-containing protein [Bacillota bacterium]|nr:WYL domain-containing protein [Bacillota bacterium]